MLQNELYTLESTHTLEMKIEETMKTVKVVTALCQPYRGSHRSIFVDRFYTSLSLMKALDQMDLYVTGTIMKNKIPAELRIAKSSHEYKRMNQGDFKAHTYQYTAEGKKETK